MIILYLVQEKVFGCEAINSIIVDVFTADIQKKAIIWSIYKTYVSCSVIDHMSFVV